MAWIRDSAEPGERQPLDIVWLVLGAVGVVVLGIWAQARTDVDANLFRAINSFPDGLRGPARVLYALGSIWAVAGAAVVLLMLRRWQVALRVAVAGVAAWAVALALHQVLDPHSVAGLGIKVRVGAGPAYVSTNLAVVTAVAVALAPYLVRPVRRLLIALVVVVGLAAVYLGAALPSDAAGALLLGLAAGSGVLVAFGASDGRPSLDDVRRALVDLGVDVGGVQRATDRIPRVTVVDVTLTSGQRLRVDAYGRDQRDGQIVAKLWQSLMYREPSLPVFGTRLQQVEHVAYILMLAERAGVAAPRAVKTGMAGPDAALLLTTEPTGVPLASLAPERITDAVLGAVWDQTMRLHGAGISHGNLDGDHIRVDDDGSIVFDDFAAATAGADRHRRDRDLAAVVVVSALAVGNERATAAAVAAIGAQRVAEIIPVVQPAALPGRLGRTTKRFDKTLKTLRTDLAAAAAVEHVKPLKIKRLSLVNIGMLVGVVVALAVVVPSIEAIDFSSVQHEYATATWPWVVAAAVLYPLILTSEATALLGSVNADPPLIPTVLMQLSTKFLGVITPDGVGGTALQVRYFNLVGVPVASATSAVVLSSTLASLMQLVVLIPSAAVSSTSVDLGGVGGTTVLIAIPVVAAAIGLVLLVPRLRGRVMPVAKRAVTDLWTVIRDPHKALKLFGGNLGTTLAYPALLGLCLLAFGQSLDYPELFLTQVGAGLLSSVAPVPGGVGVQEAALTGALTGFGVPANPAVAAVLLYRGISFTAPVLAGYPMVTWLRRKGYA